MSPTAGLAAWSRALADPQLRDLPYKVETNEQGQLILSPHELRHSLLQSRINDLLRDHLPSGHRSLELAIQTAKGVKVADVAWISDERLAELPEDAEAIPIAPEIVVEVLSGSNTGAEVEGKRRLYFAAGAHEVWTCDSQGRMRFFNPAGEMEASALVPGFPTLAS